MPIVQPAVITPAAAASAAFISVSLARLAASRPTPVAGGAPSR